MQWSRQCAEGKVAKRELQDNDALQAIVAAGKQLGCSTVLPTARQ